MTKLSAFIACILSALLLISTPAWASSSFNNGQLKPTGEIANIVGDNGSVSISGLYDYTYSIAYNVNDTTETAFFNDLSSDMITKMAGSGVSDEIIAEIQKIAKESVTSKKDTYFETANPYMNMGIYMVHAGFSPRTKIMQDKDGKAATIKVGSTDAQVRALGNDFTVKKSELVNMLSYGSTDSIWVRAGIEIAPVYTEDNLTLFKNQSGGSYYYGVSGETTTMLEGLMDNPAAGEYTINIAIDPQSDSTTRPSYAKDSEFSTYLPIKMTVIDDTKKDDSGTTDNTDNNNTDNGNADNGTTNNNSNSQRKAEATSGVSSNDGTVNSGNSTSTDNGTSSSSSPQTGDMVAAGACLIAVLGVGAGGIALWSKRKKVN